MKKDEEMRKADDAQRKIDREELIQRRRTIV
jgi:hypothetical protein